MPDQRPELRVVGAAEEAAHQPMRRPYIGDASSEAWSNNPRVMSTGSGGGNDGMMSRIAKLEACVEHIQGDIGEIKSDYRHMLWGGLLAVAMTWGGLILLGIIMFDKFEMVNSSIADAAIQQERTLSRLDKVDGQTSQIIDSLNGIMTQLRDNQ